MIKIIPSILTHSPEELVSMVKTASVAERIHVDAIDGIFVDNITVFPESMADLVTPSLIDFHLSVDKPVTWLDRCRRGHCDRVIAQIEKMIDVDAFIDVAHDMFGKVGLAIDLETPVSDLIDHPLEKLNTVLVMSIKDGWGGQEFHESALEKIVRVRELRDKNKYTFTIGVDGGVTTENIGSIVDAGADEFVVGRRLFDGDLADNIQKYQKAAVGK